MARIGACLKVDSSTFGHTAFSKVRHTADPVDDSGKAALQTTFETDLATLVADGASPTEGHVTTVNDDYTALKAAFAAVAPATDVQVSVDVANVPTQGVLRKALDAIFLALVASGRFTE